MPCFEKHRVSVVMMAMLCAMVFALTAALAAQDPFGDVPAPVGDQPADPAAKKADAVPAKAGERTATKAAAKNQPADELPPREYSLGVQAVIARDPKEPHELVRAVTILLDLDEPDLAKGYLTRLRAIELDDPALAQLVKQLGTGPFVKIAGAKVLAPDGQELADRAIRAATSQARNPERLARLVGQLGDASVAVQRRAAAELLDAHEYAVAPLLTALRDRQQKAKAARAREVLVALGVDAIRPLIGALEIPDEVTRLAAIDALAVLGAGEAAPYLVGLAASRASSKEVAQAAEGALVDIHGKSPTFEEAVKFLTREANEILSGQRPLRTNVDGHVELWEWDAEKRLLVPVAYPLERARAVMVFRLASDLHALAPNDDEARRLYLISMLQAEAYRVGLDNALPQGEGTVVAEAAKLGVEAIEDALHQAMGKGYSPAATAAAQILGEIGTLDMLARGGARPAPLVDALRHADRRLRFAATAAVVKLQPATSFTGSSHLTDALVYFATSVGERRALVAFPNLQTAQTLAGLVNALGYETDTATNGREAFLNVSRRGDYELIVLSSRLDHVPLNPLLQDLRKHPPTAQTPIVLLAEEDELPRLQLIADEDRLTTAVLRPRDLEGMRYAADQAMERAGDRIVPPAVRERQAKQALIWIAELAAESPKVFDFRSRERELAAALNVPALGPLAADVLAGMGTHFSQQALLGIANRNSHPLSNRQAAAAAFGESVRRYGVRLTRAEILKQYDRYNRSAVEDEATQELLGAVLDAIELPSKANAEARAGQSP